MPVKPAQRFITITVSQTRNYGAVSQTFTISEHVELKSTRQTHETLHGISEFLNNHFREFEKEGLTSVPPQLANKKKVEDADYIPKTEPITRIVKKEVKGKVIYYAQTQSLHSHGAIIPKHIASELALEEHLASDHLINMKGYFVTYVRQHSQWHVTKIWRE